MFDFAYSYHKHVTPRLLQLRYGRCFDKVRTLGMFIGYPRSGHSLMGALLDAHPQMLFSQDLNITGLIEKPNYGRVQIFGTVLERSREFARSGATGLGHEQGGPRYPFKVPNQYQGRQEGDLLVVGDKQAPATTLTIGRNPALYHELEKRLGVQLRLIHMIRNPFINISGIYRVKNGRGLINSLQESIDYYFKLCDFVSVIAKIPGGRVIDVRIEEVIAKPEQEFKRLSEFLEVDFSDQYVADCRTVLFEKPRQDVSDIPWSTETVMQVAERSRGVSWLDGYEVPETMEAFVKESR